MIPSPDCPIHRVSAPTHSLTSFDGARKLIEQAIHAELATLMVAFSNEKLEDGRARLVRHGHLPGRWIDNRMIERLWRSLKYERVYLNTFETGSESRRGISAWLSDYNEKRQHSSHGLLTPAEACDTQDPNLKAAAWSETNARAYRGRKLVEKLGHL